MRFFLCALLIIFSLPAQARFYLDSYGLGYGFLMSGIFTEAVTDQRENSLYGSLSFHFLNTFIGVRRDNSKWSAHLRGAYTLIPRTAEDDAAKISQWRLSALMGYHFEDLKENSYYVTAGLGVLGTISKGQGGAVTQGNSAGTATFYRPSNDVQSKLLMLEVGFNHYLSRNFKYSVEGMINGLFGDRRNLNIYFNLSYAWNPGLLRRIKIFERKSQRRQDQFVEESELKTKKRKKIRRKKRKSRKRQ